MASRLELLQEARRRGLLPPNQVALLEEVERRGLGAEVNTAEDVVRSAGRGVAKGALGLATLPGTVREAAFGGAKAVAGAFGASPETIEGIRGAEQTAQRVLPSFLGGGPSMTDAEKELANVGFRFSTPQTTAGEFAQTIGEFAPGAAFPGSIPVRVAQVFAPALTSETAGQLTSGTVLEPFARLAGAILGGASVGAAQRLITPSRPPSPEAAADIAALRQRGVRSITAGQRADEQPLIRREAQNPESFAGERLQAQTEEFTEATLRLAGIQASRARQDVLSDAAETIGGRFDRLQEQASAVVSPQMRSDAQDVVRKAANRLSEGRLPKVITNIVGNLQTRGSITGTQYKEARSELTSIVRGSKDSNISGAASDLIGLLDEGAEAWLNANRPDLLGAWQATRSQFQNLLVIEKAASFAGKEAARGLITPARLQSAVKAVQGPRAITRGRSEAGELARAGVSVLDRPSTSGTAENLQSQGFGQSILGTLTGAGRRFSVSRPGQARLSNQIFPQSSLGGLGGFGRGGLAGALVDPN